MKTFLQDIKTVAVNNQRVNFRDREAHYASGALTCLRDQYWDWIGEKPTNPTDFLGMQKMMIGDALEKQLVSTLINNLSTLGYVSKTQVPIGGKNPLEGAIRPWHGYLDVLVAQRVGDAWTKFVVEIKTKSGYGADMFYRNPEPDKGYMIQLGLYMYELYRREGITDGCFLYYLLSDATVGKSVQVNCRYNPENATITAYSAERSDGTGVNMNVVQPIAEAFERWRTLDLAVQNRQEPKGEYQYKYPLTPEILRDLSDTKLKSIIEGNTIFGDWQPAYSKYKAKQLKVDGLTPARTEEEIAICRSEYKRRHPKSKI